jgi:HEAT repeat protein
VSPSRGRWLFVGGILVAAVAVAAAITGGEGDVDTGDPPPAKSNGSIGRSGPEIPPLVLPPGFPVEAALLLQDTHAALATSDGSDSLLDLARAAGKPPLESVAAGALTALAPTLDVLLLREDDPRAPAAMRLAAALSRAGGDEGRKALAESGLVEKAVSVRAVGGGRTEIRCEAAKLLGFLGGAAAADTLVLLTDDTEPSVVAAAVTSLGSLYERKGALGGEPVTARVPVAVVGAWNRTTNSMAEVRMAVVLTLGRAAWLFDQPTRAGIEISALRSSDLALRLAAARNQSARPVPAAAKHLVKLLKDRELDIVAHAAEALGILRLKEAAPSLRACLKRPLDDRTRSVVEAALRRIEGQ